MIGFYVNAIRDVDWDQRRFYADLYWWIRYPATGDWPASDVEAIEFVNADPTTLVQKELERKTIDVGTAPEIYVNYRTVAFFHFDPDFHRYPFDVHTLPIIVEHETQQVERLFFVDDIDSYADSIRESVLWGLGGEVTLPDFAFTKAFREISIHRYDTTFGDPTLQRTAAKPFTFECSRMTLGIGIRRIFTPYLVKIMIPLIICLLLPYLVFFIDAGNLEVASGLTVTSLLACVAIQLTVVPGLPDVGYVVTSDLLFYLAYSLSMLAMAQTLWAHNLENTNKRLAHALDVAGRFA